MPSKHLIVVVISFSIVAIISGPFFKYDVFGAEENKPTIKQPLHEASLPQNNSCIIISNGDNNNPACPDNLLGLTEEQKETSPLTETNKSNDNDENTLKDEDKEESEQEKQSSLLGQQQEEKNQDKLSLNEGDEKQSDEIQKEDEEKQEQKQQQPPLGETYKPNTDSIQ